MSASPSPNFLFVAGCQRSGTTAFADYLNSHDEILITRERYKRLDPRQITPDLFSFERILDYREGETNAPRKYHEQLLARKDPAHLKWIGDKRPAYVRFLPTLIRNNPGASFILLYRAVEEVAESFEFKAQDRRSRWKESKGFERAIEVWNDAQRRTRAFIESYSDVGVLVVDYHDFFGDSRASVPLLSAFLGVEFPDAVRQEWREKSEAFHRRRREKRPLTRKQAALIRRRKDHETDAWIRAYIAEQQQTIGGRLPEPTAS